MFYLRDLKCQAGYIGSQLGILAAKERLGNVLSICEIYVSESKYWEFAQKQDGFGYTKINIWRLTQHQKSVVIESKMGLLHKK